MDSDGRYLGTLTAGTVAEALAEGTGGGPGVPSTAGELAEFPGPVTVDMSLAAVLHVLVAAPGTGLPVLDQEHTQVVGSLTHQSVPRALGPPSPV
ncbi:hypothetical protein [Streptomyces sp. RKAG337]|uniref:hypothetical protein n=1 Tax=Streptomyces sp. RKAG337 TaxID=2893404 RepID=UPI0020336E48|nr:hypothetical protein [Streptomyces sp. RKAG337]MCM2428706.1 hypothetical protein [Streptomyces sp. RKAG337]